MARDKIGNRLEQLVRSGSHGDVVAIAQLLTLIEDHWESALGFLSKLKMPKSKKKLGLRLGITGPPGAGKSTLVNEMIKVFREKNMRVAVLAVDPSSPFSGGALLGDRVRMSEHASDSGVFIRSIGSRGGMGGLSGATGAMARILEVCQFEVIIIESVGVGQTELQIMNLADATAVVLVPESGDVIQTLKAGILEIADCFVVNKSDRSGADLLAKELETLGELEGRKRKIFLTSALQGKGVSELSVYLLELAKENSKDLKRAETKARGELRALALAQLDRLLLKKLSKKTIKDPYSFLASLKLPTNL